MRNTKSPAMSKPAYQMRAFPVSELPRTAVGRQEFLDALMHAPVLDEDGNDTGETCELISRELYNRLANAPLGPPDPTLGESTPVDATVERGRMGS